MTAVGVVGFGRSRISRTAGANSFTDRKMRFAVAHIIIHVGTGVDLNRHGLIPLSRLARLNAVHMVKKFNQTILCPSGSCRADRTS